VPSRQREYRVHLAGKAWRWVYKSLKRRRLAGLCNYTDRTVTICTSVRGVERLDTELHEALHALQSFASEEHTAEVATALAQILWQLGYRLTEENDAS
jgi:predicted RecB family endonuclease